MLTGIPEVRTTIWEMIVMARDPVCGMDVDEKKAAAKLVHNGQTYYFCTEACKRAFQKEPEKYTD